MMSAAQIEESPRRVHDVVNVMHHIECRRAGAPSIPLNPNGEEFLALRVDLVKAERSILYELGFCVHAQHPHKLIVNYLHVLGLDAHTELAQRAWNYLNDSLRTPLLVCVPHAVLACACILLATRHHALALPESPPWWRVFDVPSAAILEVGCRRRRAGDPGAAVE